MSKNPFSVQTPEDISAEDAYHLFVDVFTDFYQVPMIGHTFLNGPRGSGKSMMFRYMLPDCQKLQTKKNFNELDYFSIYIPIKKTSLNLTNLERLENHAQYLLNEHLMVSYMTMCLFDYIGSLFKTETFDEKTNGEFSGFYSEIFLPLVIDSGFRLNQIDLDVSNNTFLEVINKCSAVCSRTYADTTKYMRNLFLREIDPYNGPLCLYLDFLHPLIKALKNISAFPSGKPFFLLIDDADNLNFTQTKVLNTWVSYRTSAVISLKVSTQLNYKSYRTISGQTIDSPHDYSEVNISITYTSSKSKYFERIKTIVEKRLQLYIGKTVTAEKYFPFDVKQEQEIVAIGDKIKSEYGEFGRGATMADDVKRYARPDYIKELKSHRSGSTYNYSGFFQLVSISSAIIRYFLEPASLMYSEALALNSANEVEQIPNQIQDSVIKEYSDNYIFKEFENIFKGEEEIVENDLKDSDKLLNLISALGGMFHEILVSNASERRVFSVALSSKPNSELLRIFNLGVQYGYIQESTIGNKQGTGRTKLYILSRLLSPHFKLDPTSFAGYKFLKSELLAEALTHPNAFIGKMKASLQKGTDEDNDIFQLSLFE